MDNDFQYLISEQSDKFSIYRDTIYLDRIVVFEAIDKDTLREYHFDKISGKLIDREQRQKTLPSIEFTFDKQGIKGIAEHVFLDTLEFNDYNPKGIDIETIVVRLFKDQKEIRKGLHTHPVNKFPNDYFNSIKSSVDWHIDEENARSEKDLFLKTVYSKWSIEDKVNYHYSQILFQDRMQGGIPSGFTNPASVYLSKWFIDEYQMYDNNTMKTLELIAIKFKIDTKYLNEMIKYDINSPEWKIFAEKLKLIEE